MNNTYKVPMEFLEDLDYKISKMNKRANKLGLGEISYEVVSIDSDKIDNLDRAICTIKINEFDEIKINGYEFVGKMEKNVGSTYIYKGYESVPKEQRDIKICQHCNTNRNRKAYYILKNEDGEYITVGKTCLKDFIGHEDVEKILKFYETSSELFENMWDGCFTYTQAVYSVDQVLKASLVSIESRGYYKSSSDLMSTREHVQLILDKSISNEEYAELFKKSNLISDDKITDIKNTILSINSNSEYIDNLQALIKDKFVKSNMLGFVVSIPLAYEREMEKRVKEKNNVELSKNSDYVGVVGEKLDIEVDFLKVNKFESYYGTSFKVTMLYNFIDKDGNIIVWRTGKEEDFEVGKSYLLSGKVKEHKEYKDIKQTVILRAKYKAL